MTIILNPVIALATGADTETLMEISRQTFVDTYGQVNTEQNMRNYISANFSEHATSRQLAEQGTRFYLVSTEGRTIGYLKLNSGQAQTEQKDENTLEIERIYVLKEFQGKGVGKLLVDKAIEVAKQERFDYLWLGVWEENKDALKFYNKVGFLEFGRHIFILGDDEQKDIMMKLEIN